MLKQTFFLILFWIITPNIFAQQNSDSTQTLHVIDYILCKDVVEREPLDQVSSFSVNDERAWIFARVYNSNGLTTLYFNWYVDDENVAEIPVKIGNSINWRTYSNVNLRKGVWRVELIDESKKVLSELRFNVSE